MTALPPSPSVGAITVFTEDLDRSKRFYAEVFGLPVAFEDASSAVFRFANTIVNVLDAAAAPELVGPAAVAGPGAGVRYQLTVLVADVDAVCAELARRGADLLNGPVNRPWGVRTAAIADPGGHIWEFAQDLP